MTESSQHTAGAGKAAVGRPFMERKRKPSGEVREFACTLRHRQAGLTVVRWVMPEGGGGFVTPLQLGPGTFSDGYFWARRPYTVYRFRAADGRVLGHRLDAVADVRMTAETVEYRDLALDWWVLPDGEVREEDADELEAFLQSGVLSAADGEAAAAARLAVYSRYRRILDEVADIERRLG